MATTTMKSAPVHELAPPADRPSWAGPRGTAVALLAIGVLALAATFAVPAGVDGAWAPSGPRFVPLVVSAGLIALSLAFLARVTIWPDSELGAHAHDEAKDTDWVVLGFVAAGLLAYVLLIEPLGYVVASTLFFPFGSRVLGRRALARDALTGAALAVTVYLLFTRLLGVPLPPGALGF
jgi:putative tricarboxylic transport membrane protein